MTREKKSPGIDIKTQKSSELHSQGKGVKGPPVQMSKHLRFALYVTHTTHATLLKSNMKKQYLDFTLESNNISVSSFLFFQLLLVARHQIKAIWDL